MTDDVQAELSRLRALVSEQGEELGLLREVYDAANGFELAALTHSEVSRTRKSAEVRYARALAGYRNWRSKREGT